MIALCLQTYPGDCDAAMDLTKLICELEPKVRDTEFVLVYRKDCDLRLPKFFEQLAGMRFARVVARMANNYDVGWPGGSNMLAGCAFMTMAMLRRQQICQSEAFLLFEPDCLPLSHDWLDRLTAEWNRVKALGKEAFGHMGPPELHMNGNVVFRTDYFDQHPQWIIGTSTQGWDYFFRDKIVPMAVHSDLILSDWNRRTEMTQAEWDAIQKNGIRPALYHGAKLKQHRALARANLLNVKPSKTAEFSA